MLVFSVTGDNPVNTDFKYLWVNKVFVILHSPQYVTNWALFFHVTYILKETNVMPRLQTIMYPHFSDQGFLMLSLKKGIHHYKGVPN